MPERNKSCNARNWWECCLLASCPSERMGIRGNRFLTLAWIATERVSSVLLLRKEEWGFQNLPAAFPSCHSALLVTSHWDLWFSSWSDEAWSCTAADGKCRTQTSGVLYREKRSRRRDRIDQRVVAEEGRITETFGWRAGYRVISGRKLGEARKAAAPATGVASGTFQAV